ncbi:hypothetical protein NE852_31725 (plasmid) [Rhizobium sp. Pop5]|uniref:hypothetical protein n=1 Tax=Rhizobium sp. Pop5 TaxID=1223565 RepID=UPI0021583711|nr:hypothetical protein [Rhizobium sp. Pop5]UVD60330.1 hypothetical protein NE852_31725 [Rhizobium sp. Pop5]
MKQISYIRKLSDAIGKSLSEKLQLAVDDEAGEACGLVRVEDVASYQAIAVPADSNPALISASSSKPFRCSNLEARTEDSINEIPAAKVALLLAKDDEGYIGNRPERCDAAQGPPLRIEQFASLSIDPGNPKRRNCHGLESRRRQLEAG